MISGSTTKQPQPNSSDKSSQITAKWQLEAHEPDENVLANTVLHRLGKVWGTALLGLACVPPSVLITWIVGRTFIAPNKMFVSLLLAALVPALVAPPVVWLLLTLLERVALAERAQAELIEQLRVALDEAQELRGLLPICAHCKDVRDDQGYWHDVESFISQRSRVDFSHSLCPECFEELYPEVAARQAELAATRAAT